MNGIVDSAQNGVDLEGEEDRHSYVEAISPMLYPPAAELQERLEKLQSSHEPPKRLSSEGLYRSGALAEALWIQQWSLPQPIESPYKRFDFTSTPPLREIALDLFPPTPRAPKLRSPSPPEVSPPQIAPWQAPHRRSQKETGRISNFIKRKPTLARSRDAAHE